MPNRMIPERLLIDEGIASLGWAEETLYRRLWQVADDYGRFHANPTLIRAACYPLQLNKVSDSDIEKWIACVQKAALVRVYPASDGKRYLEIQGYGQRIQGKSKFPDPPRESREVSERLEEKQGSTVVHGESRCPTVVHRLVGVEDEEEHGSGSANADPPKKIEKRERRAIPYEDILVAYSTALPSLVAAKKLTPKRKRAIEAIWSADPKWASVQFFERYFAECADDPFLNGTGPYREPHAAWRPNFDYLTRMDVVIPTFERALSRRTQ